MAVELQPIPPDPVSNIKLWRDFFSNVYEILKTNQGTSGGGSIPFSSITYPSVQNNAVFIGPLNNSGTASFRQLTLTDITNALSQWLGNAYITTLGNVSQGAWQAEPIQVPFGGTGLTVYDPGDMLYALDADTLDVIPFVPDCVLVSGSIEPPTWEPFVPLVNGGTETDLTGTGGTSQVLMQEVSGDPVTVRQLTATDLDNGITGTGSVVLADGAELSSLSLPSTGAAAAAGTATLVAGTVTVNTTAMSATALLFINRKTNGGVLGTTSYTQVDDVSFTIVSSNALDTSTFVWQIINTH